MKNLLTLNPVLKGIDPCAYDEILSCANARTVKYKKDSVIFTVGTKTDEFGILISGTVHIENIDVWGNRVILHSIQSGNIFAETYALCNAPMTVYVTAVENSEVLFIDINALLSEKNREKAWYTKILHNMLILSANKNLAWSDRVFCTSSKSIRTRVMNYLSSQAIKCSSMDIIIPFNRQQMADYLNVERSALSKELGKMQKDGILTFNKNKFRLLKTE